MHRLEGFELELVTWHYGCFCHFGRYRRPKHYQHYGNVVEEQNQEL
jgi:hypothetical protein